jgi:type IV secretory pathway VirB10-like protein
MSEIKVEGPSLVLNPLPAVSAPTGAALASVATIDEEGLLSSIIKKFNENKLYIYIAVGVIILGFVLYYLYAKNKSITNQQVKQQNVQQANQAKQAQVAQQKAMQQMQAQKQAQQKQMQMQMEMQKQAQQMQMQKQKQKPKLKHPGSDDESSHKSESESESVVGSESESDGEIKNDLDQYDLTNSELNDITDKLKKVPEY